MKPDVLSVQAFNPGPPPQIWEIIRTNDIATAVDFAKRNAIEAVETKIVERTDPYSNIGTVLAIYRNGERQ